MPRHQEDSLEPSDGLRFWVQRFIVWGLVFIAWRHYWGISSPPDARDAIFEGLTFAGATISLEVVRRIKVKALELSWTAFTIALLIDVLDEFTVDPNWIDMTASHLLETAALIGVAWGLTRSYRRLEREVARAKAAEALALDTSKGLEEAVRERTSSIREANDNLTALNAQLRDTRDAAEASCRSKAEFVANMSHEIRTPMNVIIGMTELTLASELDSRQRKHLRMVKDSAESLLKILDDILDFSKMEANKLELEPEPFSLRSLLADVHAPLKAAAAEKQLKISSIVAPDIPDLIIGDPVRLRQVLLNVLGNAVKFTSAGRVDSEVTCLDRDLDTIQIVFAIRDTGIGIPLDRQREIFESFSQGDGSATRRFGGTGLGLSITNKLVTAMAGKIELESQEGQGSVFRITLPFETAQRRDDWELLAGQHLLLVSSDPREVHRLGGIIRRWRCTMSVVESADLALEAIREAREAGQSPRVVVLDEIQDPDSLAEDVQRALPEAMTGPAAILAAITASSVPPSRPPLMYSPRPISESALFNALMFGCPVETSPSKPLTAARPADADRAQGGLRILLVEDVEGNRQVALELLRRRGHSVVVATNGAEAVELFGTHSPDLILMDSQMPVMGGEEAASRIRALERTTGHRTPIIALTANAMKGDREHSLMIGMDDHVTKPIRSAELYGAIDRVMKGSHPAGPLPAVPL